MWEIIAELRKRGEYELASDFLDVYAGRVNSAEEYIEKHGFDAISDYIWSVYGWTMEGRVPSKKQLKEMVDLSLCTNLNRTLYRGVAIEKNLKEGETIQLTHQAGISGWSLDIDTARVFAKANETKNKKPYVFRKDDKKGSTVWCPLDLAPKWMTGVVKRVLKNKMGEFAVHGRTEREVLVVARNSKVVVEPLERSRGWKR